MKKSIIKECVHCQGTGLYIGMCERDNVAVVCNRCEGKGWVKEEYSDFNGLKRRENVKKVFQTSCGYGVSQNTAGGITYEEWLNNNGEFPPKSEMRGTVCPAWWYQNIDYTKKPDWDECIGAGSFENCKSFKTKWKCWERWDEEYGT